MRILQLIAAIGLAAALAPAASAQFSVSGPGATIPFSGTGGGGTWDTIQPPGGAVATSTVTVTTPVANIDSVQINDLNHSWIGDLQVTLADPNGVEHNVFVRPGYGNTSFAGNSGDFLGGDYVFVESGGLDLPNDTTAAVVPPAGTYNQDFDTGGFLWTSGMPQSIFRARSGQMVYEEMFEKTKRNSKHWEKTVFQKRILWKNRKGNSEKTKNIFPKKNSFFEK